MMHCRCIQGLAKRNNNSGLGAGLGDINGFTHSDDRNISRSNVRGIDRDGFPDDGVFGGIVTFDRCTESTGHQEGRNDD